MVEHDQGAFFGEQLSALANSWKARFGKKSLPFLYTLPNKALAPKIAKPKAIEGKSSPIPISDWDNLDGLLDAISKAE
jgi:hypothetical protein